MSTYVLSEGRGKNDSANMAELFNNKLVKINIKLLSQGSEEILSLLHHQNQLGRQGKASSFS